MYANTTYTMIEISPRMAARQRDRVQARHRDHCVVINQDILTYSKTHRPTQEPCFFLAMEVLDNSVHDKVSLTHDGQWFETWVDDDDGDDDQSHSNTKGSMETQALRERLRPLTDPWIVQTLEYFPCELPLEDDDRRKMQKPLMMMADMFVTRY